MVWPAIQRKFVITRPTKTGREKAKCFVEKRPARKTTEITRFTFGRRKQ